MGKRNRRNLAIALGLTIALGTTAALFLLAAKPKTPGFLRDFRAESVATELLPLGSGPVFVGTWNVPLKREVLVEDLRAKLTGWSEAQYVGSAMPKMTEFRAPDSEPAIEKVLIEGGRTTVAPPERDERGSWSTVTVQFRPSSSTAFHAALQRFLSSLGISRPATRLLHRTS